MTFAQRRNRLTTHFYESIPVVKRSMTVNAFECSGVTVRHPARRRVPEGVARHVEMRFASLARRANVDLYSSVSKTMSSKKETHRSRTVNQFNVLLRQFQSSKASFAECIKRKAILESGLYNFQATVGLMSLYSLQ